MKGQRPFHLSLGAKEAPAYWAPSTLHLVLATGVQTNNSFTLIHQVHYEEGLAASTRTQIQDMGVYILKGQCTFKLGPSRILTAHSGDLVAVPKLTEFSFTVNEANTELLNFYTPAGLEQITIGTSCPAMTLGPPPPDLSPAPVHQIKELYAQYGVNEITDGPRKDSSQQETNPTPAGTPAPFITNNQTAPAYWVMPAVPELLTVLASGEQTDSSYTLTEILMAKGNAVAPVEYGSRDEIYYILDGNATFLLADRIQEVGKGDFVFIPRGTVFALRVDSETMRSLVWHTPSGIVEGTLPLLGGTPAKQRTLPPPQFERPSVDPESFMAHIRALQIRIIALPDPLRR